MFTYMYTMYGLSNYCETTFNLNHDLVYHFFALKNIAVVMLLARIFGNKSKQLLIAFVISTIGNTVKWVRVQLLL